MIEGSSLILIVDDADVVRNAFVLGLKTLGYRVQEAHSGDHAWGILSSDDHTIDLVLSDINMPGQLQGTDLAYRILDQQPDVAVILMSNKIPDNLIHTDPPIPFYNKLDDPDLLFHLIATQLSS